MQRQGGGAYGAPLSYLNPYYREPTNANGGSDLHTIQPGLARPVLNATGGRRRMRKGKKQTRRRQRGGRKGSRKNVKRGGFYPSVMGSFTTNGAALVPATIYSGYRFLKNYKGASTRRRR